MSLFLAATSVLLPSTAADSRLSAHPDVPNNVFVVSIEQADSGVLASVALSPDSARILKRALMVAFPDEPYG